MSKLELKQRKKFADGFLRLYFGLKKCSEAATGCVSVKKLFLKFSQISQQNTCVGVSRLQHRCFPINIVKFLRKPILKNICERLL